MPLHCICVVEFLLLDVILVSSSDAVVEEVLLITRFLDIRIKGECSYAVILTQKRYGGRLQYGIQ